MKKYIYVLIIGITMVIGVNGVEAETLFECKYTVNFVGFGSAKDKNINFGVVIGDSKKTTSISDFSNITGSETLGGLYITKKSGLEKLLYESATSSNTCPDITFYLSSDTTIQITTGNYTPDDTVSKTVSGKFIEGTVQEGKKEIVCSREKQMRNELYDVTFIFYTINGEKYWKLSNTSGVKVTDVLSTGIHTFSLSTDIVDKIYSSSTNCQNVKTYLKCVNGAVENIEFTGKKPADSENCSYDVKSAEKDNGSDVQHNSNNNNNNNNNVVVTDNEVLKLVQEIYNIIKILIPVLIIALSIIDFLKVILISDDKNYKSAWDKFIKRLIIGIIFFLVPIIVSFILKYSGIGTEQSYLEIFK